MDDKLQQDLITLLLDERLVMEKLQNELGFLAESMDDIYKAWMKVRTHPSTVAGGTAGYEP